MSAFHIKRVQSRPPYAYEDVPVSAAVVREILEYMFNTRKWKSEPELLHRRIAQWRQRLYAHEHAGVSVLSETAPDAPTPEFPPADPSKEATFVMDDDPAWLQAALVLRVQRKASWNAIATRTNKPRSTVQRVVRAVLEQRGLVDPVTAS